MVNWSYSRSPKNAKGCLIIERGRSSSLFVRAVERYRLTEDGTRMVVEFTLEDPEYIVGSMTHTRELIYSPQRGMSRFECDPEAARRFVPQ